MIFYNIREIAWNTHCEMNANNTPLLSNIYDYVYIPLHYTKYK